MPSRLRLLNETGIIGPGDLTNEVFNNQVQLFARASASTLLAYDILITMDKEVKYFWKTPFTPISFLYFLNRYTGLLEALVDVRCGFVSWFFQISSWISILAVDVILLIRVLALYERSQKLTMCLSSLLVVEAAVMLWCLVRIQLDIGIDISIRTSFAGIGNATECGISVDMPRLMFVLYWIPPTVFELVLLVLSVRKGAEFWRETAGLNGFKLIRVLIRDQVVYFALILACGVANVILIYVDEGVMTAGTIFTNATAPCILGSRILVNLREAAGRNVYASGRSRSGSESGAIDLGDMRFAQGRTARAQASTSDDSDFELSRR
ncbi:hypothetical protein M0805_002618 [Coniferiporia weirii]|nr:hypothetical protein M0805_002618 [Coniferiporia weirii]